MTPRDFSDELRRPPCLGATGPSPVLGTGSSARAAAAAGRAMLRRPAAREEGGSAPLSSSLVPSAPSPSASSSASPPPLPPTGPSRSWPVLRSCLRSSGSLPSQASSDDAGASRGSGSISGSATGGAMLHRNVSFGRAQVREYHEGRQERGSRRGSRRPRPTSVPLFVSNAERYEELRYGRNEEWGPAPATMAAMAGTHGEASELGVQAPVGAEEGGGPSMRERTDEVLENIARRVAEMRATSEGPVRLRQPPDLARRGDWDWDGGG